MTTSNRSDVVVIGGGPAGSTTACLLARQGHAVTVLERAKFPRDHVGESMLPFCYEIFEELGVLEEMKRRYVRKPGVRFLDADDTTQTWFCFGTKMDGPNKLSFQVLRSEFDELLLDNAAKNGATVHEETRVTGATFEDGADGGVVIEAVGPDGEAQTHRARFVVDASGRDTFLANRLGSKTAHKTLERTSLSSHWRGAKYAGGLEEGMIQIVYLGGDKQGWIWCIPLSTDRVSVGVVMNTSYYREQRKRLKSSGDTGDDWQHALYLEEIEDARFTREILADASEMWPIMYNGDYSYTVGTKFGDRFALVGDASAFIDPIFSSGVYLAMNSARLLSNAVDTRLRSGAEDGAAALGGVYDTITKAYALVDKLIRVFYTPESINWAQLGSANELLHEHHDNAIKLQHFLLAGDFFEQADKYHDFVDTLREPKVFRAYKNLVIDRQDFVSSTCHNHDQAFPPRLGDYDKVRAERGI